MKKQIIRRLELIGISICVFFMYSESLCLASYSKDDSTKKVNFKNNVKIEGENVFLESINEENNINKKIDEEVNHNTGLLDEDIEQYLNENGVFDEELENISDIKNLNNLEKDEIQVFTGYFAVSDTKEEEGTTVTDDEMIMLDKEEVDSLLGNMYYGEENEIVKEKSKETKISLLDKILMSVGMKPVNAYAFYETKGGGSVTYLKKTLMVYSWKVNEKECVKITYSTIWTTMPKYRNVDVVSLYWTNATYENFLEDYASVNQYCDYKILYCYDGINGKNKQVAEENQISPIYFDYYANPMDLKKTQYFITSHGIVCAAKLHEDSDNRMYLEQQVFTQKVYNNETIVINVFLQKETNKADMTLYPYYQHYKSKLSVKRVISGIIGAGFGIASDNYVKAAYELACGLITKDDMDFSGVTWSPRYVFK